MLKGRLNYANVMATIAVFIALGGGAYAVSLDRNQVRSKHLAKDTAKAKDIATGAVRSAEMADGAVGAAEVGDGAIGGSVSDQPVLREPEHIRPAGRRIRERLRDADRRHHRLPLRGRAQLDAGVALDVGGEVGFVLISAAMHVGDLAV